MTYPFLITVLVTVVAFFDKSNQKEAPKLAAKAEIIKPISNLKR